MSILRHTRLRLAVFWTLFGIAAVATGVAVWVLHATVRAGMEEDERRVLAHEIQRMQARASELAMETRHALIAGLGGLHEDGLTRALQRWDETQALVTGTFEWGPARGLLPGGGLPDGETAAQELPELWLAFAAWRREHGAATSCDLSSVGPWRVEHVRTVDNPIFAARDLGYQTENLDVLAYAGRPVDPWAGWAARSDAALAPWILWYRAGPDAPVRGCRVDPEPLVAQLMAEFGDTQLVSVVMVSGIRDPDDPTVVSLAGFPALNLGVSAGAVLTDRRSRVQLSILAVALLAGVFVVGAGILGVYSRREARDAERKTTFVSQVSHELRTPLTSIRMFADMLGAPGLPEDKRTRFAATISRESQRLGGLIERLLAFNALESGRDVVAVGPVDVAALVRETLEEMEAPLREAGLRLERALPAGEVVAPTDRNAVKQALINLLDNAAKYARAGGEVRVAIERTPARVVVRVSDRGPGIPAALRARVFDPFVQGGSRALTDKAPGVGLGLSIARGLLRSAGGDLVLTPAGEGATFDILIPLHRPS